MIRRFLFQTRTVIRFIFSVIFLTAVFYLSFAVLADPLCVFLERKIEFIYGLF